MKKTLRISVVMLSIILLLTGCGSKKESQKPQDAGVSNDINIAEDEERNLDGHSLLIFCGAGMKNPFEKIAQQFEENTGCEVQVTYGNAAQIQTQITKSQEGDFFIAGSKEEVKRVEEFVISSKDLVKHIPVLAVASGNPKGIARPSDIANEGIKFIMGDPESTPIGKIANEIISDLEIKDKVDIVANTATAPAMVIALEAGEADVALVWKENVKNDKVEVVESKDMDKYIKTIPSVMLNTSIDEKAQKEFNDYLDTQEVKDIWIEFGYEIAE